MALTNESRTILRSRVRRHPDVDKHVPNGTVSNLSNADLEQVALLMGLDVPTPSEDKAYLDAKSDGDTGRAACLAADAYAANNGLGGAALSLLSGTTSRTASQMALSGDEDDDTDAESDFGTPDRRDDVSPAGGAPIASEDVDAEKAREAKAKARVSEIQAMMGQGDFKGYSDALYSLAHHAYRPDPKPKTVVQQAAAPIDPSKIKGHVPAITGTLTMSKAGIRSAIAVDDAATTLPVYDAPDAPAKDAGFVWPDATGPILATLADGDNVFIYGPAGTGKTSLGEQIAATWGRPFVRISCEENTEAATLMGSLVPSTDGGVEWHDGQLTAAIRKPGTVVLVDEPTVARAGALFVLQAVLDGARKLYIPDTGEVVHVAPDVVFLLADNTNGTGDDTGQYEATRILNRATLDRAAITVRLDYLPFDQEVAALMNRTGVDRKRAGKLCRFAAVTRSKADNGEVSHGLGLRRLISLAKRIRAGIDANAAFQMAVLETAPHDDREPLRQMWATEINGAL